MKTASRIMYIIGLISNIALFIISIIGLILFIVAKVNPDLASQLEDALRQAGAGMVLDVGLGLMIYLVIASFIVMLLTFRALKRGVGKFIHIILMIGGILAWDIFYVLGGIFGLCSRD